VNPLNNLLVFSITGRKLTESFEGLRLVAYQDQGGIWTVGYGHTGPEVHDGYTITAAQADQLLAHDVTTAENAVKRFVTVALTQNEFDAMVDLAFNIGAGNFLKSTLLRLVNQNNFAAAADQFARWNKVSGKVNAGLARRRMSEEELFEQGFLQKAT
jgi:lysozyme